MRTIAWIEEPVRRAFLRLAHAHGAALGLLNVGVAWALVRLEVDEGWAAASRGAACLGAYVVALGFLGGGLWHGPTDPGPLVVFVPAGALLVLAALVATVVGCRSPSA
jgi:hypothetical protein